MSDSILDELEAMSDKYCLDYVLQQLSDMCDEKAYHVRTNWQDNKLANVWMAAGKRIRKAAKGIEKTRRANNVAI